VEGAVALAGVAVVDVAVVALLDAGVHGTITADVQRTVILAGVVVAGVAVVARLASPEETVTADGLAGMALLRTSPAHFRGARRIAAVTGGHVGVVALLAGGDHAVATPRVSAIRIAAVAVDQIAIIALLARLEHAVAAQAGQPLKG